MRLSSRGSKSLARGAMRIWVRLLGASLLASAGLGRARFAESEDNNIRIGKLLIESNSLPDADRERIIHLFHRKTYFHSTIPEPIRFAFTSLGYSKPLR